MDGVTLYLLFLAIAFAIVSVVALVRCARVEGEYEKLRAEVDHAERDENLRAEILKECDKRIVDYTLSSVNAHEMDYHD